jgi:hypothetical protein
MIDVQNHAIVWAFMARLTSVAISLKDQSADVFVHHDDPSDSTCSRFDLRNSTPKISCVAMPYSTFMPSFAMSAT